MPKELERVALVFHGSKPELQKLIDVIPAAVVVVDQGGRVFASNTLALALFGLRHEEAAGLGINSLLPERLGSAHGRHLASYFASPRVRLMGIGLNLTARSNDGSEFPVELALSPVDVNGTVFAMAVIADARPTPPNAPWSAQDIGVSGQAAAHSYGLTLREYGVLCQLAAGMPDKQIAIDLMVSVQTVHKHVGSILRKMAVGSRTEATSRAFRENLLIERQGETAEGST
jgi:PAS domain S-box-containing protein